MHERSNNYTCILKRFKPKYIESDMILKFKDSICVVILYNARQKNKTGVILVVILSDPRVVIPIMRTGNIALTSKEQRV